MNRAARICSRFIFLNCILGRKTVVRQINTLNLKQPKDKNAKIWRYMDFTKFVSLLSTSSLFLARADTFEDPFEGRYLGVSLETYDDEKPRPLAEQKFIRSWNTTLQKFTAISCWHVSEYESAAMWKLYLKSDEGIAIQSTYRKLFEAIRTDTVLSLGEVEYIDHIQVRMKGDIAMQSFFHKRRSFEHEKELRLLHQILPINWPVDYKPNSNGLLIGGVSNLDKESPFDGGIAIPIEVNHLVEQIYISPTAQSWFKEVVKNVTAQYKYNFQIVQSSLYDKTMK